METSWKDEIFKIKFVPILFKMKIIWRWRKNVAFDELNDLSWI